MLEGRHPVYARLSSCLRNPLAPPFYERKGVSIMRGRRAQAQMHRARLQATRRSMPSPPRRFLLPRHPLLQNFPLQEPTSLRSLLQMQLAALLCSASSAFATDTHACLQSGLSQGSQSQAEQPGTGVQAGGGTSSAPPRMNDSRHLPPCPSWQEAHFAAGPFLPGRAKVIQLTQTLVFLPWPSAVKLRG